MTARKGSADDDPCQQADGYESVAQLNLVGVIAVGDPKGQEHCGDPLEEQDLLRFAQLNHQFESIIAGVLRLQ